MFRAVRIALVLLYLAFSVGVTVAVHVCGGEPVSADLFAGAPSKGGCCCGTDEPMPGCCSTSYTSLRLNDDHAPATVCMSTVCELQAVLSPGILTVPDAPLVIPASAFHPPGHAPSRHILCCSLLI